MRSETAASIKSESIGQPVNVFNTVPEPDNLYTSLELNKRIKELVDLNGGNLTARMKRKDNREAT